MRGVVPIGVLGLVLAALLIGCADESSPEAQIRQLLDDFVEAVETRALRDATELLADDYHDRYHGNRAAAMRSLLAYTQRQRQLHLFRYVDGIDVETGSSRARAVVYVAITRVPAETRETLVSMNAELYRFDIEMRVDDGRWRVVTAAWGRAGLSSLP